MRIALLAACLAVPGAAAHGGIGPEVHVVFDGDGFAFEPFEATVSDGLPITWTDATGAPHTVTSVASPRDRVPDGRFNATLAPTGSVTLEVAEAQDAFYACLVHDVLGLLHVVAAVPTHGALVAVAALVTALAGRAPGRPRRR